MIDLFQLEAILIAASASVCQRDPPAFEYQRSDLRDAIRHRRCNPAMRE
jgi:hypothetical protein